ncbi:MAG: tRNA (N6-threonylcarbamoyladenosine(37)-N6)-methyltransferase TrmO [Candidatus Hydrogenedens sp.]|nr:tRNA (N6-threonylcarbamoyladenosine(37)-N6)-methyltransferase TrmO [Candidatus Hydrogenedens sp.]
MADYTVSPIGIVRAARAQAEDDFWGGSEAAIQLVDSLPEDALEGIDTFSHVEVIYLFDRVPPENIVSGARHPRNNPDWPRAGIFAQRGKGRPNRLGATVCRVLRREGRTLYVAELDAIDGTPVLDIKPVLREFLPRGEVHQPDWATELMRDYWKHPDV